MSSRQVQHSEINNLINSNEIKLDSARIGCCVRYYLTFPNDNHKYYYNSNKPISTILQNKISNHLYTMSKIRLNQKTHVLNDNVGANANVNDTRLKYAINNKDVKIEKIKIGNRKGLQSVISIGDKQYQYNPNKISKVLITKIKQLTTTPQFNATQQIKKVYQGIRLRK